MKSISCVAGLLAALTSLSVIAQTPAVHPTTLSSAAGRYVFGQINGMARDQYMLDTQTGRLWQLVCAKRDEADSSKCDVLVLQAVSYSSAPGLSDLPPAPQTVAVTPRKRADDSPDRKQ